MTNIVTGGDVEWPAHIIVCTAAPYDLLIKLQGRCDGNFWSISVPRHYTCCVHVLVCRLFAGCSPLVSRHTFVSSVCSFPTSCRPSRSLSSGNNFFTSSTICIHHGDGKTLDYTAAKQRSAESVHQTHCITVIHTCCIVLIISYCFLAFIACSCFAYVSQSLSYSTNSTSPTPIPHTPYIGPRRLLPVTLLLVSSLTPTTVWFDHRFPAFHAFASTSDCDSSPTRGTEQATSERDLGMAWLTRLATPAWRTFSPRQQQ